jgi:hypothetical protein
MKGYTTHELQSGAFSKTNHFACKKFPSNVEAREGSKRPEMRAVRESR